MAASNLDTQFTLYCSGFESVGEQYPSMHLKAYSENGHLGVESQVPADVTVYDLTGRLVATNHQVTLCTFNLVPGLYLVKAGNEVVKAIVR